MTELPLALSIPHAGLDIPTELTPYSLLTPEEIAADGDVGAAEIYLPLESVVVAHATTAIARAFVDLNRQADDRRKDGVVKTHTCWDVPVYRQEPPEALFSRVLQKHYSPYHQKLTQFADNSGAAAAIDCHTMAEFGPPVGPDPGQERPLICLGNANGDSCPTAWVELLADCLQEQFSEPIAINEPFSGGFITRHHGKEMPWIQLEFSRTSRYPNDQKRRGLMQALENWCRELFPS